MPEIVSSQSRSCARSGNISPATVFVSQLNYEFSRSLPEIEPKRENGRNFNEKTERPPKTQPYYSWIYRRRSFATFANFGDVANPVSTLPSRAHLQDDGTCRQLPQISNTLLLLLLLIFIIIIIKNIIIIIIMIIIVYSILWTMAMECYYL